MFASRAMSNWFKSRANIVVISSRKGLRQDRFYNFGTIAGVFDHWVDQNHIFMAVQLTSLFIFTFNGNAIVKIRRMLPFHGTEASSFFWAI